jgi:hypothetical protein
MAKVEYPTKPYLHGSGPTKPDKNTFLKKTREIKIEIDRYYGLKITDFDQSFFSFLCEKYPNQINITDGEILKDITIDSESYQEQTYGGGCCSLDHSSRAIITIEVYTVPTAKEEAAMETKYQKALAKYSEDKKVWDKNKEDFDQKMIQYEKDLKTWKEQQKKIAEFEKTL